MMKSILEVKEDLRADFVRVFCAAFLPFALYYLYLDIKYSPYIEESGLINPLSYADYLVSHTPDFGLIAFTVIIVCLSLFFGSILGKLRVSFMFRKQINQLNNKLNSSDADTSLQRTFIQRVKIIGRVISETMEHVQSADNIPLEGQQSLIKAVAELAAELSKGLCANLKKEPLVLQEMIEQTQKHFTDYMQNHNIKLHMTCPEDLTVTADPLFTRLVFLNILGLPLCSTQTNGEISIDVNQKNGYAHVEVHDNRYILTGTGKQHLKFPHEFLAEADALQQLCLENGWSYELKELGTNRFYTKVSIPLEDYQDIENNVMGFGFHNEPLTSS